MTLLGRQDELLEQLCELLTLPSSSPPPANNKLEPAAAAPSSMAGRRGRRSSSKRGRDDEVMTNNPAAGRPRRHYCKRRKKEQQSGTSMVVMSAPDVFDGYQWKKYGQKLIEGAMYPRSYYRCTRSAEQGCAAKRTVQRNDDDEGGAAAAAPMYTVVSVGEHTCTANDSPEAPVILETTAFFFVNPSANNGCTSNNNNSTVPASSSSSSAAAVGSCSTTTTAGTESPAISDGILRSSIASRNYVNEYDCHGLLTAAVHDNDDWVLELAASSSSPSSSFPTIEDFTGPIRSPVHVSAAADGWTWTIDQLLLQLVNEPTISVSISEV